MTLLAIFFFLGIVSATPSYDVNISMGALYYTKVSFCHAELIKNWTCGPSCLYHPGVQVINVYHFKSPNMSNPWDLQGYAAYNPSNNQIVIAFRGSHNIPNVISDVDAFLVPYPMAGCEGCQAHQGWYSAWQTLQEVIRHDMAATLALYPNANLLVTGHSLGAALSLFCALDLSATLKPPQGVTVHNFGQPRIGNPALALWASMTVPNHIRVTHNRDPVPQLPFAKQPIPMGYLHSPHEIWFPTDTAQGWRVCADNATTEDPLCLDSVPFYDWQPSDHLKYLGVELGGAAC